MSSDYTTPHWESSALILVDVQQDFLAGPATIAGTAERVGAMAHLANCFRRARRPIVHVVRLYPPGGHDVDPPRRAAVEGGARIVAPGSDGAQIPDPLVPHRLDCDTLLAGRPQRIADDEVIMFKPRWSAFYRTRLDEFLRDREVDTVVVAGCNLPNCPRATLFDASERDYRTVLATDATSQTTDPRLHDLALLGVHLSTSADVEVQLGRMVGRTHECRRIAPEPGPAQGALP